MKYTPPPGSTDPDAKYVTGNPVTRVKGSPVPAEAVENPQREIVEVIKWAGLEPSNGDLTQLLQALQKLFGPRLLEFQLFRHPDLYEGFEPCDGSVIEDAAERYPEAWAKLQTSWGQKLCKTESEWQELSTKTYYTLADGTKVGFNGIGGVGYYSLNTATGSIRMPDIRGQFFGAAGAGSLNVPISVGESDIDHLRQIWGQINSHVGHPGQNKAYATIRFPSGVFAEGGEEFRQVPIGSQALEADVPSAYSAAIFDTSKVVPTSQVTAPPRISMLACAYMGQPAG